MAFVDKTNKDFLKQRDWNWSKNCQGKLEKLYRDLQPEPGLIRKIHMGGKYLFISITFELWKPWSKMSDTGLSASVSNPIPTIRETTFIENFPAYDNNRKDFKCKIFFY